MTETPKGTLLVVDDEPLKRVTLQIELSEAGYTTLEAPDAVAALKLLASNPVDVVISDVRMPEIDGMQFLEKIKAGFPKTHVILMTAFSSVGSAVEAMKLGAYDYIAKPFRTEVLLDKLERVLAGRSPDDGAALAAPETVGPLVGRSHAARRLFEQIRTVADNDHPVMIMGEPGTCRDRVADAIHRLSQRWQGPLIKFSCAASSPQTIDGELFGSGASDATVTSAPKAGRLELAGGGILFLDNVDALPLELQAKLLHALEEGIFEHAGNGERVSMDARLICGTERDLRQLVDAGEFRRDLYYRLDAIHLVIPPLRARREDIPLLVERYLKTCAETGDPKNAAKCIDRQAMDVLVNYHWPANVRELEHVLERAITFAKGGEVLARDILLPAEQSSARERAAVADEGPSGLTETIAGVERTLIDAALRRAAGNQAKAAQFLGIPRTTLRDKMTKYGMVGRSARQETVPQSP